MDSTASSVAAQSNAEVPDSSAMLLHIHLACWCLFEVNDMLKIRISRIVGRRITIISTPCLAEKSSCYDRLSFYSIGLVYLILLTFDISVKKDRF